MKHNPLGVNLVKGEQNHKQKIGGDPRFTDRFLDRIERDRLFEGREPPEGDITIYHYKDNYHNLTSRYTINKYGEVKSLRGQTMKYMFHPGKRGPVIRLQKEIIDKNGNHFFIDREFSVLKLMEKKFGIYLKGYSKKKENPNAYILVPKDGDYNNMRFDNLHYITKKEYYAYKEDLIKTVLIRNSRVTTESLCETFSTKPGYVYSIKTELAKAGKLPKFSEYQKLQKEIGIEFSEDNFEIYKLLVQTQGKLSNMEIAKLLRPEEIEKAEDKSFFTNKIVRARKKLTDKGVIPRFNEQFESKKDEAIQMIKDKVNSGKTNQEIADILGLRKTQIDNLAKQIKKESSQN